MRVKKMAAIAVTALIAGLLIPATSATAQEEALTVFVSSPWAVGPNCNQETGQGCTFGESMRFMGPNTVNVHDGQVVTFEFHGFHTATLLPPNTDVQGFIDSQVKPFGAPFGLVAADPDEGATGLKANNAVAFPSDPTCGTVALPCPTGGPDPVNSGLPFDPTATFSVEINGQPGDTIWVICLLHPHMRMRFSVVGNNSPATTPAEIATAAANQHAADEEWGGAANARYNSRRTSHTGADGVKVWDAWAGVDNHHATLYGIYPKRLPVEQGDRVRYHFDNLTYEDHTATTRNATTLDQANSIFAPECDPDGDNGSDPDNPPDLPAPPFCANPTQLELSFPFALAGVQGNGVVVNQADVEGSGLRGANAPVPPTAGESPYTLRFGRAADKPIVMFCQLHPFMVQRVRVRR
ncbi:MAG: hypothetical protein ACRDKT_06385 [Actinomycetota bacterium]